MRDIVQVISEELGLPLRSITLEEAPKYFDWMAMFAGMDNPASSAITQAKFGWAPTGPGLIEDMRTTDYFA